MNFLPSFLLFLFLLLDYSRTKTKRKSEGNIVQALEIWSLWLVFSHMETFFKAAFSKISDDPQLSTFFTFLLILKFINCNLLHFFRPGQALLNGTEDFTVLIKNWIVFPKFNAKRWGFETVTFALSQNGRIDHQITYIVNKSFPCANKSRYISKATNLLPSLNIVDVCTISWCAVILLHSLWSVPCVVEMVKYISRICRIFPLYYFRCFICMTIWLHVYT